MTDSTDKPTAMNSKTNTTFHFNTVEVKNSEGIEVTDKQENLKLKEEIMSIEEPEQFDEKMTFEVERVSESINLEDTAMAVDEAVQQETTDEPAYEKSGKAENLMESDDQERQESLIQPTRDETVTVGHDSLINGSQQNIPEIDNSVLHPFGSMKDAKLKDLVNRELSKLLMEEQEKLKHAQPPLLDVQPEYIIVDEQIENPENTSSDDKTAIDISKYYTEDALSTLANAALNLFPPIPGSGKEVILKPTKPTSNVTQEGPAWCDVGVIQGTTFTVKHFYPTSNTDEHEVTSLDNLTDYTNKLKSNLEPGTLYKFRVAGINACGRGEWSDVSIFKTTFPNFPFAPFDIKVRKSIEGAKLTWEIPPFSYGNIEEYSVCMATKKYLKGIAQNLMLNTANHHFVRVYSGPQNSAIICNDVLNVALIDKTKDPAIIFRIAAKNECGYGPATQVRWLQDIYLPGPSTRPF
ncbi:Fibronectin type III,Immunoglobulin-like fold [Cinara cedri]|uniref:Fibronectin type III,Immunoglobulin-like fold n=1 Tax=Cinara cedri TaxID=506608 RepID=A0A5E4MQV9_9HEMI|nr:Fibronectin type III,Immunoglobulin-like fold [Cinara cedri]